MRAAVLRILKERVAAGRATVERMLMEDGGGTACASRLSYLMDEVSVPSTSSRRPTCTGRRTRRPPSGWRRRGRRLRPRHAGAGLRHRPPVPAALQADAVGRESSNSCSTCCGTSVEGRPCHPHHRRMHPPVAHRHDHPHRDPRSALHLRRRGPLQRARPPLRSEIVTRHGAEFVAAKLAERDERHRKAGETRYLVEPNVKEGKGGLRDLHTLFWIAKYFYRVAAATSSSRRASSRRGIQPVPEGRRFPVGGALPPALPHRQGRGAAVLRHPARDRRTPRLHQPSRPAAVERFMKHYFLVAKDVGDLTRIFCAALEEQQAKHVPGSPAVLGASRGAGARSPAPGFRRRQSPHQRRRRHGVRARSGQSDPALPSPTARARISIPMRMQLVTRSLDADRPAICARTTRRTGCSSTS